MIESEKDYLMIEQINGILQAIKSMRFNRPQCPIQILQTHSQVEVLELDILENNPIFFIVFKQKLYK